MSSDINAINGSLVESLEFFADVVHQRIDWYLENDNHSVIKQRRILERAQE